MDSMAEQVQHYGKRVEEEKKGRGDSERKDQDMDLMVSQIESLTLERDELRSRFEGVADSVMPSIASEFG